MFSSNVDASAREVAIQLLARREYSRSESFIRSRISRGQGLIRIKGELRQRGVDQETQAAALAAVEEREAVDWFELARETLERRFSTPGDSPKERAKRERFLAARGFDFEQIRYALSCL